MIAILVCTFSIRILHMADLQIRAAALQWSVDLKMVKSSVTIASVPTSKALSCLLKLGVETEFIAKFAFVLWSPCHRPAQSCQLTSANLNMSLSYSQRICFFSSVAGAVLKRHSSDTRSAKKLKFAWDLADCTFAKRDWQVCAWLTLINAIKGHFHDV